jgi:hypothetical protein
METRKQPESSAMIERMDRKLALAFGAIILVLMLIAAGSASYLYIGLNRQEEARLAGIIARILDQSINKVAFSGKYHTRLLIEEMKATVPDLASSGRIRGWNGDCPQRSVAQWHRASP